MRTQLQKLFLVSIALLTVACERSEELVHEHNHEADDYYTCPMHPEIKEKEPGTCPICHMPLAKVESSPTGERKVKFYRHPMNPEITSNVPAKDEMGMDYIAVYEDEIDQFPSVAGRGKLKLSPLQIEQAGIQTMSVETHKLTHSILVPGRVRSSSQISIQIYESDLHLIEIGQAVSIRSPLLPDRELEGRLQSLDSFLDPMTRTVQAMVQLRSPADLRIEGSVKAAINVPIQNALAVPSSAIFHTGTEDLVFVVTAEGEFFPRSVVIGRKSAGMYQIKDGLKEGEVIALGPNFLLDSEARIRGTRD